MKKRRFGVFVIAAILMILILSTSASAYNKIALGTISVGQWNVEKGIATITFSDGTVAYIGVQTPEQYSLLKWIEYEGYPCVGFISADMVTSLSVFPILFEPNEAVPPLDSGGPPNFVPT